MVLGPVNKGPLVGPVASHIPDDLRYQNKDFRKSQAQRYLNFFEGNVELSAEEHYLIPSLCYWEIRKIQAWNSLTKVEQCIFKICDPFFSRLPNDRKSSLRIFGASVVSTGALMVTAYTGNNKIVGIALIGFLCVIYNEMRLKKIN